MLKGPQKVSREGHLHLDHAFEVVHDVALPQANDAHDVRSEKCQRVRFLQSRKLGAGCVSETALTKSTPFRAESWLEPSLRGWWQLDG